MTITLLLAAAYNVLWGAWVVLFPLHIFRLAGVDIDGGPHFWPSIWWIPFSLILLAAWRDRGRRTFAPSFTPSPTATTAGTAGSEVPPTWR